MKLVREKPSATNWYSITATVLLCIQYCLPESPTITLLTAAIIGHMLGAFIATIILFYTTGEFETTNTGKQCNVMADFLYMLLHVWMKLGKHRFKVTDLNKNN